MSGEKEKNTSPAMFVKASRSCLCPIAGWSSRRHTPGGFFGGFCFHPLLRQWCLASTKLLVWRLGRPAIALGSTWGVLWAAPAAERGCGMRCGSKAAGRSTAQLGELLPLLSVQNFSSNGFRMRKCAPCPISAGCHQPSRCVQSTAQAGGLASGI